MFLPWGIKSSVDINSYPNTFVIVHDSLNKPSIVGVSDYFI